MKKKPISPLQALSGSVALPTFTVELDHAQTPEKEFKPSKFVDKSSETILSVDPSSICNWEFHDRTNFELGDLEALAFDLKNNGQAQPCVVRRYDKSPEFSYELIVGERRWRAAQIAGINLLVIIKNLSDHQAATLQISENNNRKDLSDFSRGMNYAKLIAQNILQQKDLENILQKDKREISRLLSFRDIPQDVWDAIEDPTHISARTAGEMRALINKGGEPYKLAIISLASRLRSGKLGASNLVREIEKIVQAEDSSLKHPIEVRNPSGRHLFSWRKDSNGNIGITFPKDVRDRIDRDKLERTLISEIDKQLLSLSEP